MATKQLGAPATSGTGAHTLSSVSPASVGRWWWPGTYQSGWWYVASGHFSNSGNIGWPRNRVHYIPFTVWDTLTITALSQRVITAGDPDALLRTGFYSHNPATGTPESLISPSWNFSAGVNSAGVTTFTSAASMTIELATPFTLAPGMYWAAGVVTDTPTTNANITSSAVHPIWHQPLSSGAVPSSMNLSMYGVFQDGATELPATPTINHTNQNTSVTQIGLRMFMRAQ